MVSIATDQRLIYIDKYAQCLPLLPSVRQETKLHYSSSLHLSELSIFLVRESFSMI